MQRTVFEISKMDCPSEENLVRMKLDGFHEIAHLDFDISGRKLTVFHTGDGNHIEHALHDLDLGSRKLETAPATQTSFDSISHDQDSRQRKLLWAVLAINFAFFAIEMTTGLISKSMGLVADSLDMLADAFVYAISLFAVGGTVTRKKNIATTAGYFQLILAAIGFIEVVRRFIGLENVPDFTTMILVSILALIANAVCLYLLQKSRSKEAHMQASMIFTSNDVIINLGVIIAALLVNLLDSSTPDLIIGAVVFILVIRGATRILKLGR